MEGRIVREYAFIGDSQEGIARDGDGYLYITQDSGRILKVKDLR
jgi:glucose/arabinose dehydrogenase